MSPQRIRTELTNLESILNNFIGKSKKSNQKKSRIKVKYFLDSLLVNWIALIFLFLLITHGIAYRVINNKQIDPDFQIPDMLLLYLFIVFIISIFGLVILLLIAEIKLLCLEFKTRKKLLNKLDMRITYRLIEKINSFSVFSVESFEEKLKLEVDNLNANIKDLDLYLPILIGFMILATKYVIGININIYFETIDWISGGLSFFAASSIVIKILIVQSTKEKIRYYKKFLSILKEAAIARNN